MSFCPGKDVCNSYSYGVRAVIQCLPAWFRFIQCLRRYRDTKRAFPHLVNAGKYSTSFFVVTFAALYSTHKGRVETHTLTTYCSCILLRSIYKDGEENSIYLNQNFPLPVLQLRLLQNIKHGSVNLTQS